MSNLTPSATPPTETPADKFRRIVAAIAAQLDETYPAVVIADHASEIDDDSGFYGADDGRPVFIQADEQGWGKAP